MSWLQNLVGGGKPKPEKFGEIVHKHLKQQGVEGQLVYDAQTFAINVVAEDGSVKGNYFLQNAYDDYCRAAAGERQNVLDGYFANTPEMPKLLKDAITNVMPRVQMRSFFEQIALQQKLGVLPVQEDTVVHRVMAEHFALSLIFDTPKHVSYISASTLDEWETSFDELFERALVNLARVTPEPLQRAVDGLYYSHYSDTHDATRILLTDRIKECRVKGRPVAVMPNRNRLFIVGDEDLAAQEKVIAMTEKSLQEESRPMPVFPLVFDNNTWSLWSPPPETKVESGWTKLHAMAMNEEYSIQKELLDQIYDKEGTDLFVANYMVFQKEGHIMSVATLAETVATVLPKADRIGFVFQDKKMDSVFCLWDDAVAVIGPHMTRMEGYPERWLVDYFPNAEEMNRIRAKQI